MTGVSVLPAHAQPLASPDLSAPYTWVEEFESDDALQGWKIFRQPDYGSDKVLYTEDALSIEDGQLTITTRRHCLDEDVDISNPTNNGLYGELDLVEHFSYGLRAPWSP